MKTKIQLPTSTTQIGQQLLRHFNFTIAFDVNNPGPASRYPQFQPVGCRGDGKKELTQRGY